MNNYRLTLSNDTRLTVPGSSKLFLKENLTREYSTETDGVDERVDMGNACNHEKNETFSVFQWVKVLSAPVVLGTIFGKCNPVGIAFKGYYLYIENTGGVMTIRCLLGSNVLFGEMMLVQGSTEISTNTWYHVGFTYDGSSSASGIHVYVNGQPETMTVLTDNIGVSIVTSSHFCVGALDNGTLALNARHYCISSHTSELTAGEVSWIYNNRRKVDLRASNVLPSLCGFMLLGGRAVWDGANNLYTDQIAGGVATSANMDLTNIIGDAPSA